MATTATCCALCKQEIEGIPYGPMRAEVCATCWFKAGTYKGVSQILNGHDPNPKPAGNLREISEAAEAAIRRIAGTVEDLAEEILDALKDGDIDGLLGIADELFDAGRDLERAAK
jgi:hypothetical protein